MVYDRQILECIVCKYKWIIQADRTITEKKHKKWLEESLDMHDKICSKKI